MTIPIPPSRIAAFVVHWRHTFGAVLIAMLAEALLLVGVAIWLTRHVSAPPTEAAFGPIQLDLTRPPTPEPAPQEPLQQTSPAASEPEPPADQQPPAPEQPGEDRPVPLPEPPSSEASSRPISPRRPMRELAPMPLPDLSLLPRKEANAGPRQSAPLEANGQTYRLNEFAAQLNAALRAASHYPKEARGMRLAGRVLVRVHYRDGKVWAPTILRSSGFAILDNAVLDGLARADWPPPPPGLEGRELVVPIVGSFW